MPALQDLELNEVDCTAASTPKRVLFANNSYAELDSQLPTPTSHSLKSAKRKHAGKGILKPFTAPRIVEDPTAQVHQVLDSAREILSRDDRSQKIDIYETLSHCFRSYDSPQLHSLAVLGLVPFVRRDIVTTTTGGNPDNEMRYAALKVLAYLCHDIKYTQHFSEDDNAFFINQMARGIRVETPKRTLQIYMVLLHTQTLSPHNVNQACNDIVAALDQLNTSEGSIQMERLACLERLIAQCPNAMAPHICRCVRLAMTGLLSLVPVMVRRAIGLLKQLGRTFQRHPEMTKYVYSILAKPLDKRTVQEALKDKCRSLCNSRQGALAADIWTCLTDLMSGERILAWRNFNEWLDIIKMSFNAPDTESKCRAHFAWARLIHTAFLSNGSNKIFEPKTFKFFLSPIKLHLGASPKTSSRVLTAALSTFYTLYYILWRPQLEIQESLTIWNELIQPVMQILLDANRSSIAEETLLTILAPKARIVRREERLFDSSPLSVSDLPPLDPKFIRTNDVVLVPVSALKSRKLWNCYLAAVNQAAAKEMRVTSDALTGAKSILGFLESLQDRAQFVAYTVDAISTVDSEIIRPIKASDLAEDTTEERSLLDSMVYHAYAKHLDLEACGQFLDTFSERLPREKALRFIYETYLRAASAPCLFGICARSAARIIGTSQSLLETTFAENLLQRLPDDVSVAMVADWRDLLAKTIQANTGTTRCDAILNSVLDSLEKTTVDQRGENLMHAALLGFASESSGCYKTTRSLSEVSLLLKLHRAVTRSLDRCNAAKDIPAAILQELTTTFEFDVTQVSYECLRQTLSRLGKFMKDGDTFFEPETIPIAKELMHAIFVFIAERMDSCFPTQSDNFLIACLLSTNQALKDGAWVLWNDIFAAKEKLIGSQLINPATENGWPNAGNDLKLLMYSSNGSELPAKAVNNEPPSDDPIDLLFNESTGPRQSSQATRKSPSSSQAELCCIKPNGNYIEQMENAWSSPNDQFEMLEPSAGSSEDRTPVIGDSESLSPNRKRKWSTLNVGEVADYIRTATRDELAMIDQYVYDWMGQVRERTRECLKRFRSY